jgi:hypothetical protein
MEPPDWRDRRLFLTNAEIRPWAEKKAAPVGSGAAALEKAIEAPHPAIVFRLSDIAAMT